MEKFMIEFTEEEMLRFLQKRMYRIATWPCTEEAMPGMPQELNPINVAVAFKDKDREDIKKIYWDTEMREKYGFVNTFNRELKKALLRL